MNRRDFEQIDAFLGMVGRSSLFEYYDIDPFAPVTDVEAVVKKRRSWAQGQQANPKFRNEAIWLIKNQALVRKALLEERDDYRDEVANRSASEGLKQLDPFIRGVVASGVLTQAGEDMVLRRGEEMGIPEEAVLNKIDAVLAETGASRENEGEAAFVDLYDMLGVSPDADLDTIEVSHRERYREARNLKNREKAEQIYAQLDEAWRVLQDPTRRATYDALHRANQAGRDVDPTPEVVGYLLPPDGMRPTPPAPAPVVPPAPVDDSSPDPAEAEERPGRGKPPPPPAGIGRTLPSQPKRRRAPRAPRLSLASPELVTIRVSRRPVVHKIVVKNAGQGKMPGRITSDREWVQVSRSRLDPDARQQEVEVVIQPKQMQRSKGVALVTVVTDHGERRAITLRVERTSVPPRLVLVGVALVALIVVAFVLRALLSSPPAETAAAPPASGAILDIRVDPSADRILVDGSEVGRGDALKLTTGFPLGRRFQVTAELAGFTTQTREVKVDKGQEARIELSLPLEAALDTPPRGDLRETRVDSETSLKALATRRSNVSECLVPVADKGPVLLDIFFGGAGELLFVEFPANLSDPAARLCIQRQLRAVKFPVVETGSYAVIRDQRFTAPSPGSE